MPAIGFRAVARAEGGRPGRGRWEGAEAERAGAAAASAQVDDDDAAVRLVLVVGCGTADRNPHERQLEARLVITTTFALLLLALPYLLDDEGRQHWGSSGFGGRSLLARPLAPRGLTVPSLPSSRPAWIGAFDYKSDFSNARYRVKLCLGPRATLAMLAA